MRAQATATADRPPGDGRLWWRWFVANIAGEVVGFGLAMLVGVLAAPLALGLTSVAQWQAVAVTVVLIGIVEGVPVGLAQWLALRAALPGIPRAAWLGATVAGAVLAWAAGMVLGSVAGDRLEALAAGSPVVLALVIGAVAGSLLSLAQWWVLRRVVPRAGWWAPAHALAWAAGMVVAYTGLGTLPDGAPPWQVAATGAVTGLAMGGLVAAITGLALVWLRRGTQPAGAPAASTDPPPGHTP